MILWGELSERSTRAERAHWWLPEAAGRRGGRDHLMVATDWMPRSPKFIHQKLAPRWVALRGGK